MPKEQERILNLLSGEGYLTTSEVAEHLKISRTTAIKYLEILKAKGKVDFKKAGPSKLWFLKEAELERLKDKVTEEIAEKARVAREKKVFSGPTLNKLEEALREMRREKQKKRR